ncbi:MAG: helix-hairpin-helix domain-containing protein, partial [Oscillospiraceae bacterium]
LRMYQYYGDNALQLVQDNPYILVSTPSAPRFRRRTHWRSATALTIRARNAAAATLYELAYNAVRGHCFISYRNLLAATSQLSGAPDELVAESVDALVQSGGARARAGRRV